MKRKVHIAGQPAQVGSVVRQRCSWCGYLFHEHDLATMAIHPPPKEDEKLSFEFNPGALVEVEGINPTRTSVIPHVDGDQLPAGFCGDDKPRLKSVP